MRIKTNCKAGEYIKIVLNQASPLLTGVGAAVDQAGRSVARTLADPKFWTWPW
jgi:hypothetical protein